MSPVSSAMVMNSIGRQPTQARMIPARQRLEARDRAIVEPYDRLVQDRNFVAFDRPPQIGFERQPIGLARPHGGFEHVDAVAAKSLGVIHRELGVLEPFLSALRL